MLSQKQYKEMKRDVTEYSAVGVGYYEGILQQIPSYALLEATREIASLGWVTPNTKDVDLQNMLVTESIKKMSYQDFKEVAPYLFSYPTSAREELRLVQPIQVSREYFDELQEKAEELFNLKQEIVSIDESIEKKITQLEFDQMPNGDQVLGIDLESEELLLLRKPEHSFIDEEMILGDQVITDYKSDLSESAQIIDYLLDMEDDKLTILLYEESLALDYQDWPEVSGLSFPQEMEQMFESEGILERSAYYNLSLANLRELYNRGCESQAFSEMYPVQEDFVGDHLSMNEAETGYNLRFEAQTCAAEILENRLDDIQSILALSNKELVIEEVYGYSQGERWKLAYMMDTEEASREDIKRYLQEEVGAWYRGSLTELEVYSLADIDLEWGLLGTPEETYYVDTYTLYKDELKQVQEKFPELQRFSDPAGYLNQMEQKIPEQPDLSI